MPAAARRVQGHLTIKLCALTAAMFAPVSAIAAQTASVRPIPIRQISRSVSTDSGLIANTSGVRVLADGRVLHNDALTHRLLLLDTTLKHFTVLADTAGQRAHKFGDGTGGLLPFARGDSTAWIDYSSQALVVIDGAGKFGTVMAPPKAADIRYYAQLISGAPGFDERGKLYYRASVPAKLPPINQFVVEPDSVGFGPDTAPIIRADFDRRGVDTAVMMRIPIQKLKILRGQDGRRGFFLFANPLPATDEWAFLPDGTVAIVRGQDYHVDWYSADGTHKSTPKMPFDWRRVTDEEKQRMLDSTKRVVDSIYTSMTFKMDSMNAARKARGEPSLGSFQSGARQEVVSASDLPDYYPPIRTQQVRVDRDGNLWVIPTTSLGASGGGNLFDVINHNGEIIERVQLPAGRKLEGFGPNGAVYMSVPANLGWTRLERARVIRP